MKMTNKKCDECGRKRKNLTWYQGQWLCYLCYPKIYTPLIFEDNIVKTIMVNIGFTMNQWKAFQERLAGLSKTKHKLKYSQYVRLLIISDLKHNKLIK